jgi:hypothetical protein
MLDFLETCRFKQPTRNYLEHVFRGQVLPKSILEAVRASLEIERRLKKKFMFLTITNDGAEQYNRARLQLDFPAPASRLAADGKPGDPSSGGGLMVFEKGMRVRLTQNIDKDRGFVNGNVGTIDFVLHEWSFVLLTQEGIRILVHPICRDGAIFMPCSYAYATTMRRAQGATLDIVGLAFDRRCSDLGYAYVGASRTKRADTLFLARQVRRTDWLPVGGNPEEEQTSPSALSKDTDSDEPQESDMESFGSAICSDQSGNSDDSGDSEEAQDDKEHIFACHEGQEPDDEDHMGWIRAVEDEPSPSEDELDGFF